MRKAEDRIGQIGVGRSLGRHEPADPRQQAEEVEEVDALDRLPLRDGALQDDQLAAGFQNRGELAEGGVEIRDVAQAEGDGGPLEVPVREGEGQGVGGERGGARGVDFLELPAGDGEHGHAEIGGGDAGAPAAQSGGLVAGAAAEVEDPGARGEPQGRDGLAPPEHVQVGGEQVVQQIVTGRHTREHVADGAPRLVERSRRFSHLGESVSEVR